MPRPTADPPEDFATLASACQSVVNDGDKVAVLARADQVAVLTEKVGVLLRVRACGEPARQPPLVSSASRIRLSPQSAMSRRTTSQAQ
jgi:hypothetical protein